MKNDKTPKHYVSAVKPAETQEEFMARIAGMPMAKPAQTGEDGHGFIRSAADSGLALGSGVVTGVKLISDAFGADNPVSRALGGVGQGMQGLLSEQRKAEMQERARLIAAAEKSGSTLEEIKAYVGGFAEAPFDTALNVLGTAAPTMASMLIPGAREANIARALGVGTGAVQGAGAGKSAIYDAVLQQKLQEGMPEEEARAIADAAQAYGGGNTDTILANTALGAVAGGSGLESAARALRYGKAAQSAAPGLIRRVGTGAVVEGVPEAGQGGMEKASANIALQREGYDVPTMQGVAGSAALEGVAGGSLGGIAAIPEASAPAGAVPVVEAPPSDTPTPSPIVPVTGPLTKAVNAGGGPIANAASQASANAAQEASLDPAKEDKTADFGAVVQLGEQAGATGAPRIPPADFSPEEKQAWRAAWDAGRDRRFAPDPAEGPTTSAGATDYLPDTFVQDGNGIDFEPTNAANTDGLALEGGRKPTKATKKGDDLELEPLPGDGPVPVRQKSDGVSLSALGKLNPRGGIGALGDPVEGYVRQRMNDGTMAGRAFASDYKAGRITRKDVEKLLQDDAAKAQARIDTAAASAKKDDPTKLVVAQESRARPKGEAATGPAFASLDEADDYVTAQFKRNGTVAGVPIETDGGIAIVAKSDPRYAQGVQNRKSRLQARKEAKRADTATPSGAGTTDRGTVSGDSGVVEQPAIEQGSSGTDAAGALDGTQQRDPAGEAGRAGSSDALNPSMVAATRPQPKTTGPQPINAQPAGTRGTTAADILKPVQQPVQDQGATTAPEGAGGSQPTPAQAAPDYTEAEAEWTRSTPANRLATLGLAGWPSAAQGKPGKGASLTASLAWADLNDVQRAKIAKAIANRPGGTTAKPTANASETATAKPTADQGTGTPQAPADQTGTPAGSPGAAGATGNPVDAGAGSATVEADGVESLSPLTRALNDLMDVEAQLEQQGSVVDDRLVSRRNQLRNIVKELQDVQRRYDVGDDGDKGIIQPALDALNAEANALTAKSSPAPASTDKRSEIAESNEQDNNERTTAGGNDADPSQAERVPAGDPQPDRGNAATGDGNSQSLDAGVAENSPGTDPVGGVPDRTEGSGAEGAGSSGQRIDEAPSAPRNSGDVRPDSGAAESGGSDFDLTGEDIGTGGLARKYKDNVAAIRILKALDLEGRVATPDERKQLARFVGWGALKAAFDPANTKWAKQYAELKELLTDAEWKAARASTLNAHYTDKNTVAAMFEALSRLGFKSGRVLEPSVGSGNFFGMMPAGMRNKSSLFGIELDPMSAKLAQALYPSAKIKNSGFEDFDIPAGYFDAVIGNPPFGNEPIRDSQRSAYSGLSIHNYFLSKAIDKLRPGGILQVVVSHSFLDAQDGRTRAWIGERANLIGAVRLPNTAFKENAGTVVVTDILIFQKKSDSEAANGLVNDIAPWQDAVDQTNVNEKTGESAAHKVNQLFAARPDLILGKPSAAGTMRTANEYTVQPSGDLKAQLGAWVQTLPENVYEPIQRGPERAAADVAVPDGIKVGSFFVDEKGRVMTRGQDEMGERSATPWIAPNGAADKRVRGMIALRDLLRRQMRLERDPASSEADISANRAELGKQYDAFLKGYGHLNSQANRRLFLDDPEAPLLQALELDYDRGVSKATAEREDIPEREPSASKADIFKRRVVFPPQDMMAVSSAKDALLASLNFKGRVDIDYMATVYDKSPAAMLKELGDVVFDDPQAGLVMADEYLSGDVKTKLVEAEAAARDNPAMRRNVEALRKVIPEDKRPSEITVSLGAAFVPVEIYREFFKHITGGSLVIGYVKATGQWLTHEAGQMDASLNRGKFGTPEMSASDLFTRAMLGRGAVVTRTTRNADGSTTTVVLEKETEAARAKQEAIKAEWKSWIWKDGARASELSSIYNEKMNRVVQRKFDGSHLQFPGMSPAISLLEHQKNGVWRGLQTFQTLYDHVVGAGKTFEMATLAMEMRRLGIARKPIFVVPNHLTLQWRSEFTRLYPTSNVLAATPEDFGKGMREKMFSKIVTGDWDAVIIGHSSLKKIGLPVATETAIMQEQIDEISNAIEDMKRSRGDRNIVGDMERIRKTLEGKLKEKLARLGSRDKVLTFDELGIDAVFVDEMHEFKNLTYTSTMDRVPGMGNPKGSDKSFDLFVKLRWMFDSFGKKAPIITATGTPVSNSLVEMYNMQRFMQYPSMKELGTHVFDAWARQFGSVESVYEVSPSGTGFRQSTRFAKFTNLSALMGQYNSFADVITLDDLKQQATDRGERFPVPKVAGGRPKIVVAERSPRVAEFMGVPRVQADEDGALKFLADVAKHAPEFTQDDKGKWIAKVGDAQFANLDTLEDAKLKVVEKAMTPDVAVDPKSILGQFGNLRQLTKESKGKINALSLTGQANKAGLDFRLIDPTAPDFKGSKINLAVAEAIALYKKWSADKGAQLIFCDMSIPLSARANVGAKAVRVYVRGTEGLAHKRGTLHTIEGFEGLPFIVTEQGSGAAKQFDLYDAASGVLLRSGFKTKQEAKDKADSLLRNTPMRDKWMLAREEAGEIEQEQIDDYNDLNEIDTEESASITRADIAGMSGDSKFSVYDDIKAKLIARGVPEREIAFIHDYDTPTAKSKLFRAVNKGDVRFLLGSTPKMGAGTNVQERLVGLHHIDAPWRPSDLEQREGRIIRRGSALYERDPDNYEVEIFRYATAQTYDTRRWQILEHKAKGIEQLRNFDGTFNEIEDIAGEAANSADMKAAASGDPMILDETRLRNDVRRLEQLEVAHADNVVALGKRAENAQANAEQYLPRKLESLQAVAASLKSNPVPKDGFPALAVNGVRVADRDAAVSEITKAINFVATSSTGTSRGITFRGVQFKLEQSPLGNVHLIAQSTQSDIGAWGRGEAISPTGLLQRLANYADRIEGHIEETRAEIKRQAEQAVALRKQSMEPWGEMRELEKAREDYRRVQRALIAKGPAVPEDQKAALKAALESQKQALRDAGLSEAVTEFMGSSAAKFSRNRSGGGVTMRDARAAVGLIRRELPSAPEIIVLESLSQAPDRLQNDVRNAGAERDWEAAYHDGKIYVMPDHIEDMDRFMFVVGRHEVRHAGFESMLGDQKDSILLSIGRANRRVMREAKQKMDDGLAKSEVVAIEEALADMPVEDIAALTRIKVLVAAVRRWLRSTAFKLRKAGWRALADSIEPKTWTDNDVIAFVFKAESMSRGGGAGGARSMFSGAKPGQVHSPQFKAWFGDWTAAKARESVLSMEPVEVPGFGSSSADGLRDQASEAYRQAAAQGAVQMRDGRKVQLSSVGLKKTRSHSADRRVLDLLGSIREVLSSAHPVSSIAHDKTNPGDSIRAWHYYATKVEINGKELFAKLVVRESVNGEAYYDADLSSLEEVSGRAGDAAQNKTGAAAVSADKHTLSELLNLGNVSKVVDAEGKPLVVYHGSKADTGPKFDPAKSRIAGAFFFAADPQFASSPAYTGYEGQAGNVSPVYLSLQNPKVLDSLSSNPMTEAAVIEAAKEDGFDGIVVKKDGRFIAFRPEQIKSATGNNGQYDPANPDIRFSRAKTVTNDEGHAEFIFGDTKLAFPIPTERIEVIPVKGQTVMQYAIMPTEGFDVLGHVDLLLENGKPVSLLDIEAYKRGNGVGRKTIETLLRANPGADLNISNIVPEAQGFWESMGVPVQNLEEGAAYDGTLNLETYLQAQDGQAAQGNARRPGSQGGSLDARAKGRAPEKDQGRQVSTRFSRAQTENANFKRWFGDSKVVDTEGKPLVVYHGTQGDISEFRDDIEGRAGYYFTADKQFANSFAEGYGANVMPVYLSISKPADLRRGVPGSVYDALETQGYSRLVELYESDPDEIWNFLDGDSELAEALGRAGYDGMRLSEPAGRREVFSWVAFRPEQIKSATGNNGQYDPANPDTRFSRRSSLSTLREAGARKAEAVRDANLFAGYKVGDFVSSKGTLSWWDKSIGTPFNLAKRHPDTFGRVFNAVQDFLTDVSFYATESANLAPNLLPRLDTLKDVLPGTGKQAISPEDSKAIAAPIFEGTLNWTRDDKGRPVRIEAGDEKAKPGIVFTPDELRSIFKLTQAQAALYKEFRASVDRSLDDLTVSEITRLVRSELPGAIQGEGQSPQAFADEIRQALIDIGSDDTAGRVAKMAERLTELKANGYAPLSRFGHYTLDVVDADGERVYFGLFESESEANKKARQMRAEFPGAKVQQGTQSQEAYKMLAGVSPETIELFGEILGLDATGDKESDKAFQEYLKKAKSTRSAMKRLIHRKGIAGFSEDAGRVLAGFITSNARRTASNHRLKDVLDSVQDMPKEQGELKDYAAKMAEYVQNPIEEAQRLRGLMFVQYLGGSIASALVNMTQPIAVTMPYLSQHTSAANAAKLVTGALADMAGRKKLEGTLEEALKLAEEKGIVAPQEIHYLQAQAQGAGSLVSGDGTAAGNAAAKVQNGWSKLSVAWGKLFGFAELVNRRATFIASYRLAVQNKYPNPFQFATDAVNETQFVYNKGNRPQWARGAIGATLFTFKTYSISYVELLSRMWKLGGPEGKKAFAFAIATMILMSGVDELPFMEDVEDVIDGFAQRVLGLNWQTKAKRNEWAAKILGEDLAHFLAKGVSGVPGVPLDISGRLGMGNLAPGTGLFRKDSQDPARDVAEIAGPVGDLLKRGFTAAGMAASGEVTKAALEISPVAIRNVAKGADMVDTGMYRDATGKKVIEATTGEAILKGIGFQPNTVARVQDANFSKTRMIALNKRVESEIADLWARGRFEKDPAKVEEARNRVREWNRQNPDSPIRIQQGQIQKRVRAMMMTKAERIAKTAPKEIRAEVKREVTQ